jgi:hypothetical protein
MDKTDLQPFKASDLKIGGYFYLKKLDDTFSVCRITNEDLEKEYMKVYLRKVTQEMSKSGRLFVRISDPWKSFE